jgi:hypothetical protein
MLPAVPYPRCDALPSNHTKIYRADFSPIDIEILPQNAPEQTSSDEEEYR